MKRTLRPQRAGTAALLALGASFLGCDEVVDVENLPPSVTLERYCRDGDRYYVVLTVQDYERDSVDVDLVADIDGRRARLPTGTTGDGLRGLRSERVRPGVRHRIEWAAASELVPDCATADCEARPCSAPDCGGDCASGATGTCVDTCASLDPEPIGEVTACAPRGPERPSLRLTAVATDGEGVTSADGTLELEGECPAAP